MIKLSVFSKDWYDVSETSLGNNIFKRGESPKRYSGMARSAYSTMVDVLIAMTKALERQTNAVKKSFTHVLGVIGTLFMMITN
jgi:hypothetical protein